MAIDSSTLLQHFPALQHLEQKDRQALLQRGKIHRFAVGEKIFYEGETCSRFLLVLKGQLRVEKQADNGQEIVLYHVGPGQSCKLTNICLIGGHQYPAEAFAESELEVLSLPKTEFKQALERYPEFSKEILASIDIAISDLIDLVQDVAFGHLDHRLAQLLLKLTETNPHLNITHQALAIELGTAREVVSRLLKGFERDGCLELHRGSLEIIDRKQLEKIHKNSL